MGLEHAVLNVSPQNIRNLVPNMTRLRGGIFKSLLGQEGSVLMKGLMSFSQKGVPYQRDGFLKKSKFDLLLPLSHFVSAFCHGVTQQEGHHQIQSLDLELPSLQNHKATNFCSL